jgi:hypothetical protein
MQPLLSQLPFMELVVSPSVWTPVGKVAGLLGATTTKLRLRFLMYRRDDGAGTLGTVGAWLKLLDALPRVRTVQLTFQHSSSFKACRPGFFPVYREAGIATYLEPAVEQVVTSAINACEQKGRWVHPRVVRGMVQLGGGWE